MALRDIRRSTAFQDEEFGGRIDEVKALVQNNGACSKAGARADTEFIDRAEVTVTEGGNGFEESAYGNLYIFNPDEKEVYREIEGGGSVLDLVDSINATEPLDLSVIDNPREGI